MKILVLFLLLACAHANLILKRGIVREHVSHLADRCSYLCPRDTCWVGDLNNHEALVYNKHELIQEHLDELCEFDACKETPGSCSWDKTVGLMTNKLYRLIYLGFIERDYGEPCGASTEHWNAYFGAGTCPIATVDDCKLLDVISEYREQEERMRRDMQARNSMWDGVHRCGITYMEKEIDKQLEQLRIVDEEVTVAAFKVISYFGAPETEGMPCSECLDMKDCLISGEPVCAWDRTKRECVPFDVDAWHLWTDDFWTEKTFLEEVKRRHALKELGNTACSERTNADDCFFTNGEIDCTWRYVGPGPKMCINVKELTEKPTPTTKEPVLKECGDITDEVECYYVNKGRCAWLKIKKVCTSMETSTAVARDPCETLEYDDTGMRRSIIDKCVIDTLVRLNEKFGANEHVITERPAQSDPEECLGDGNVSIFSWEYITCLKRKVLDSLYHEG